MNKMKRIIRDIVRQQIEFVTKSKNKSNKNYIRKFTYQQLIITEDGIGRNN